MKAFFLISILSLSVTAHAAKFELHGAQGVFRMIVLSGSSVSSKEIEDAAARACAGMKICQAIFWAGNKYAASSLPMTDEQVKHQLAHISFNRNTGFKRSLWDCSIFKGKKNCL